MSIDDRLHELGIELPAPFPPAGLYVPAVRAGDLVFLSGMGPVRPDGTLVTGKVGRDLDLADAREAARLTGLQLLVDVLGDAGRGARSAVGQAELPFDIAVEIEAVVQVTGRTAPATSSAHG